MCSPFIVTSGILSMYMWEPGHGKGFFACFLIKKDGSQSGDGRRGLLQHGIFGGNSCYRAKVKLGRVGSLSNLVIAVEGQSYGRWGVDTT
ncbi:unnamed protein product [Calypogeia fissa]